MADTGSPFFIPYVEPTDLVRDYPAADEAQADAIADQFGRGFQFVGTRYYTSSGTFAKADPFGNGSFDGAKMRAIAVRLVGAGGGGGGTGATSGVQAAQSGAGSGGGFASVFITDIAGLGASITVTRGGGGSGGAAGANNGSEGGSSSFGTVAAANGGGFGFGSAGTGSFPQSTNHQAAGIGTAGDIVGRGFEAAFGEITAGSPAGTGGSLACAGGSLLSGGPRNGITANGVVGLNGSGGSGTFAINSNPARAGGNGGNGIVIVDVFA